MSVGAHLCAMNSRLKAAPTTTLSEREILRCSCGRTYFQEVTVVLGFSWRITDKQIHFFVFESAPVGKRWNAITGFVRSLETAKGKSGGV